MLEVAVSIPTPDGISDGFLYRRDDSGALPGIVHLTDIYGVREASRGMARRLAGDGYTVLLPNVFYRTRQSPMFDFPPNFAEERTKARMAELATPLTPGAVDRDANAYVDFFTCPGAERAYVNMTELFARTLR
ncbi:MAG: dienelactone hydrolase family protein [Gemmatimonadota bacterium]|nr:dienelactone hydrolase family protein [Gemmatimonadota bacterium]